MNALVDKSFVNDETQQRGLLRFITAGSVDDGKSTLIGKYTFAIE